MTYRRPAFPCALALGLVVLLVAAGCSRGGADDGEQPGGAADLPGPVPAGVAFEEEPADAPPAPDFSVELVDGTPVTASELWEERPVVLVFTASWCGICADFHREAAETVGQHRGVALLGVVGDDDAEADEYARDLDLGYPIAVAGDRIWLDYAVREPPTVILVAPGGRVLRGWPGGVERDVLAGELDELYEDSAAEGE